MNTQEIINLIANSKKRTIAKAYVSGNLKNIKLENVEFVGNELFGVLFGDLKDIENTINKNDIKNYKIEILAKNSAIPLADIKKYNARIEPGAIIRDMVEIGDGAVIMMGAVINIGAVIGEKTMIDMNTVIGGRAIIGKNCHIGAGSVIAGVIEPPSAKPVMIKDNVMVGANAVILEGVEIGEHSVIAAGAVVIEDIPPYSVVAGVPAKVIKKVDKKTESKTQIIDSLRNLK
ncbi:2,3,4,5-tetrahydropyridine-2,6-carboxylate N-succinyltransferase [Thermosipho melanesiensis]|uniref:2,3,4,5-tetrahydropyridine-2,6-dicarboxylate N-acetyltransferase n=2 Tax=Thermosipho melanesiensis TaxID=46541 RepID=DAPH_THEM4|nr:2,3,4,5-tetrahydropyridine-2,6-dicarboxylate N-acetyltransferase [Thermosipho melanesiensis]A6LP60.1 RecName: Full=2,3,4,5-tetrahydropyridine-2,6-dicarboxylate N-acetyltransferase; AltName: Full=Tetrahydrodipicolinate N-acetyltransferase; Short=THP acetyltransferase; Short=Tetrahydropicolinate acetylase [Thermosipho melanesiensis BI429]ABR31711.1 Tetrahydrodipicolinate succinyltransferase N-terminal domain protein [Thermosipho melanesiensis BI429]APT74734.1 2,3,4,5-tetrahydropyridine-2,6-carb